MQKYTVYWRWKINWYFVKHRKLHRKLMTVYNMWTMQYLLSWNYHSAYSWTSFCICSGSERLCHHPVCVLQFGRSGEPCFRVRRQPWPHHGLHTPPSPQLSVLNDQPGSQEHTVLQQLPFRLPHAGNKKNIKSTYSYQQFSTEIFLNFNLRCNFHLYTYSI